EAENRKVNGVELDEVLDYSSRIDVVLENLVHLRHMDPFEELHDQNAHRRHFTVDPGNDHEFAVAEKIAKTLDVVGLVKEVHLFGNHARKFVDDGAGRTDDVMIDELFQHEYQVLDNTYICGDQFFDTRPQHLDDHLFAAKCRAVDLSEGGCRQGLPVKGVKDGLDRLFQFELNSSSNFTCREGRNLIVQARQLL